MNLYTIVTNDEYEFPVKCDVRVKEVADVWARVGDGTETEIKIKMGR